MIEWLSTCAVAFVFVFACGILAGVLRILYWIIRERWRAGH